MFYKIAGKMQLKRRQQKSSTPVQKPSSTTQQESTTVQASASTPPPPPPPVHLSVGQPDVLPPPPSPVFSTAPSVLLPDYDEISIDLNPPAYSRYASSIAGHPRNRRRRGSVSSSVRRAAPHSSAASAANNVRRRTRPITQVRRVTADHPVWDMTVDEQVRLRKMGIDPIIKAEFMSMRRGSPA